MEHLSCEGRLKELRLAVQPGEEACSGAILSKGINIRKVGCKEDRVRLFLVVPRARTRGTGHALKHRRVHLNVRIFYFILYCDGAQHYLSRKTGVSVPWIFKSYLDMVLDNQF